MRPNGSDESLPFPFQRSPAENGGEDVCDDTSYPAPKPLIESTLTEFEDTLGSFPNKFGACEMMKSILLILMLIPAIALSDSYTVEIKQPGEAIELYALHGAAETCKDSTALTLEQRFEMVEIHSRIFDELLVRRLKFDTSLAQQAALERHAIRAYSNPSYSVCSRALKK